MQFILSIITIAALAYTNRHWRGDGSHPKWHWLALNFGLAWLLSGDLVFSTLWLLFAICYAVPAWHAVFSAIHGYPPQRKDAPYIQWAQDVAKRINVKLPAVGIQRFWKRYGIIYGFVRGSLVIPPMIALALYTQSFAPFVGLSVLGMGYVYYFAKDVAKAERILGGLLGVILVVSYG